MFKFTGIPSIDMVKEIFPKMERINKGPVAVIECYEKIPCNPCATACKIGAIKEFVDINDLPNIDHELCTGCSLCVNACPGLAIMIVDGSKYEDFIVFRIPFEFLPLPKVESMVKALDRSGEVIGTAEVLKVQNLSYQDKTPIIHIKVDRNLIYEFKNIRVVE